MRRHPNELLPEELDLHFGKPVLQPDVIAIVSMETRPIDDLVNVEVVTDKRTRLTIPFTLDAMRQLVRMWDGTPSAAQSG